MKNYIIGLLLFVGCMFAFNSADAHCAETKDFPSFDIHSVDLDVDYLKSIALAPVAFEVSGVTLGIFRLATMEGVLLPFAKGLFPLPREYVIRCGNNG